jgi:hypothetical protein
MESLIINPFAPMRSLKLEKTVGRGGANLRDDVVRLSKAFWEIDPVWGGPDWRRWDVFEKCNPAVIRAIEKFQRWNFGTKLATGKVERGWETHEKINQILGGAVDIVAVAAGANSVLKMARDMTDGELVVASVQDMVSKVLDRLSQDPGKKILSLVLVGHGAPGTMTVGAKKSWGVTTITLANLLADNPNPKDRLKLYGTVEQELARLRAHFQPDAVVTMAGCRLAAQWVYDQNPMTKKPGTRTIDGKDLLKAVSRALGNVWVQAGDEKQRVSTRGMDGNCIRCNSGTCVSCLGESNAWWGGVHEVALNPL